MSSNALKFMNMWEIETHFKCPVVGAILSVEKHRDILKKCGVDVSGLKPYEYHQMIMSRLHGKNAVSVKVNNVIQNRARKWMQMIEGMDDQSMRGLWNQNLESGNVGPLMYAIVSYEDTSLDLLQDVYGQVHMMAHANMTRIFEVQKELAASLSALEREKKKRRMKTDENKAMAKSKKRAAARISDLETENRQLNQQTAALEQQVCGTAPDQGRRIQALETQVAQLKSALESKSTALQKKDRAYRTLKTECIRLKEDNTAIQQEIEQFIATLSQMAPPPCQGDTPCQKEACSRYRLCARRIFMIGGITKMKAHYKDIIEKAGGEFEYHDGYIKGAGMDIEARVKRCDLVLCPVNCNSHNACIQVKKLCHLHNTPLKILPSSSITAVSQAVFSREQATTLN